ncbi:MAG: F0F1 ATP synthase subunit delta [Bifidobacteriaceae bacterium]|nr:F0F1 ATP synthase subunit delta [Bifidobacteriaceae bacterium]
MRGETSLTSEAAVRAKYAPLLQAKGEKAGDVAQQLFDFCAVLDGTPRLERALTDPSRDTDAKVTLLKAIVNDSVDPLTVDILTDLVSHRWSRVSHIANATEDLAIDAQLYQADARGCTGKVAVELAKIHSALLNMSVLRSELSDPQIDPERRVALLDHLFDRDQLDSITLLLAERATRNLRNRRYLYTIQWLIDKISEHCGETVVTVTSAVELSIDQIKRIIQIYSKKLGRPVHVNSVVDPSVLGGIRVQYGAEVIDNTVVAKLHQLQRSVA